ncbi:hypothetical protein YC2023_108029 [Brassica napus]
MVEKVRGKWSSRSSKVERDKIGAAHYDCCLRTLVEGIKPFVVRLGTLEYWPRDKFWDLVSGCFILCLEMLETSALGLGQNLGLITALGGAMTTLTYVSCIVFDLILSRFKFRNMFLHDLYGRNRASLRGQFLNLLKVLTKISDYFLYIAIYPCVGCTKAISTRWLSLFRTLRVCCDQQQTYR